jgi:cytochrome P450
MTNPNAYMPFGMGPRNCVGMRFAMEEIKIVLCTIVKNFRFFPVAETPVIWTFKFIYWFLWKLTHS